MMTAMMMPMPTASILGGADGVAVAEAVAMELQLEGADKAEAGAEGEDEDEAGEESLVRLQLARVSWPQLAAQGWVSEAR